MGEEQYITPLGSKSKECPRSHVTSVNLARYARPLCCFSLFSRNSLVFETDSRYLAKTLENRTNIERLIYIKDCHSSRRRGWQLHVIWGIFYLLPWCVYDFLPGEAENTSFAIGRREQKWHFRPARQKNNFYDSPISFRFMSNFWFSKNLFSKNNQQNGLKISQIIIIYILHFSPKNWPFSLGVISFLKKKRFW